MKKIFILVIFSMFIVQFTIGQESQPASGGFKPFSYYTLSWNTTFTIGDFNKWVGNASPAGFNIGGRYFIPGTNFAAGYNIAWQKVWQEYPDQTYYGDNGIAITAMNYRFTWMFPFQAQVDYHFIPAKMVSPFIGLGIGGDYMEHHLMIQEYDIYETHWDFSLTPEVGAIIKFGNFQEWGALVAFNYKWTTNKINIYNDRSSSNLSMLNLRIGICYLMR